MIFPIKMRYYALPSASPVWQFAKLINTPNACRKTCLEKLSFSFYSSAANICWGLHLKRKLQIVKSNRLIPEEWVQSAEFADDLQYRELQSIFWWCCFADTIWMFVETIPFDVGYFAFLLHNRLMKYFFLHGCFVWKVCKVCREDTHQAIVLKQSLYYSSFVILEIVKGRSSTRAT